MIENMFYWRLSEEIYNDHFSAEKKTQPAGARVYGYKLSNYYPRFAWNIGMLKFSVLKSFIQATYYEGFSGDLRGEGRLLGE